MPKFEAGGETIHVLTAGCGERVIVLLHGFGGDGRSWAVNQAALASGATVHAIDLPGHGASPAREMRGLDRLVGLLAEAIAALSPTPVHLVGHSMGGGLALRVAERHPARLRALTMISPAGVGTGRNLAFVPAYMAMEDRASAEAALGFLVETAGLLDGPIAEGTLAARNLPHVYAAWQQSRAVLAEIWGRQPGAQATLAALPMPVQIIWGERDRVLPPEGLDDLPATICLHRIPGAGHVPHLEAMRAVNRLILDFDGQAQF